jgi:hypothetical protein
MFSISGVSRNFFWPIPYATFPQLRDIENIENFPSWMPSPHPAEGTKGVGKRSNFRNSTESTPNFTHFQTSLRSGKRPPFHDLSADFTTVPQTSHPRATGKSTHRHESQTAQRENFDSSHTRKLE